MIAAHLKPFIRKKSMAYMAAAISSSNAYAELPLTIEELLSDKGKIRIESFIAYTNNDRNGISNGDPLIVQTGPTSFVSIPTNVGELQENSDVFIGTLGMRYGLSSRAEIYGRTSYLVDNKRSMGSTGRGSSSESRFADAWVGINYRLQNESEKPGLLAFGELAIKEKRKEGNQNFKSMAIGVTAYKAIDPIVFSLTSLYQFNLKSNFGSIERKAGNLFVVTPAVAFSANNAVTLSAGFQWTNRQSDRLNGISQGISRTSTSLLLGAAYSVSKNNSLSLSITTNSSGREGAGLRFGWLSTL